MDEVKSEAQKKSDSYISNQANEREHLGARPKHRPPKKYNNSLDSSSPVDLIPPQVVEPVAHGVHNPLLPEHLEDKKVGHEYWEWMASIEVGLLSRLPDTETRETLKDIPQHTQFAFLLDQMNKLKEKVELLTKKLKLQEDVRRIFFSHVLKILGSVSLVQPERHRLTFIIRKEISVMRRVWWINQVRKVSHAYCSNFLLHAHT